MEIDIKKELDLIKERNRKVELDKEWETSIFRKLAILVLTYLTVVLFFYFSGLQKPFLNAIVPSMGFLLSTLSLSFLKNIWLKNKKIEKDQKNRRW
jgi:hypothetical protein